MENSMNTRSDKAVEALRASLKEVDRLRQQNREMRRAAREPIAVVAMSCRLPGGVSAPDDLWRLLADGTDAIVDFPDDRGWTQTVEETGGYTRRGGFVPDAAEFDAALFGINPREALAMDPQQRMLLEAAWEVAERAGIDPHTLAGSDTGVFVGASPSGYDTVGRMPDSTVGYQLTGTASSVLSGRLSYVFGLEGPAVTVDTACSSSLVALHLAVQSLRQGECGRALVGGVAVITTPAAFTEFGKQGGMASDGRCKSFSADADGTGWSEGVGVLLIERLSDARRNGHDVLAVIRGSAVNQDGASNGLTAPNGPSQQRVIRQALANAQLTTADIDAVEAHGTGTALGDPIELEALQGTYGKDRTDDRPLWLGSAKSNLGHSQAASGVVGVIKSVLALHHGTLPRTLHADVPTPHVTWEGGGVRLLTEARPWPRHETPRRIGVSAFGVSGTNAHLILEEAPAHTPEDTPAQQPTTPTTDPHPAPLLWPLSAQTTEALRAQAERLTHRLPQHPADVAWSLATTRAALTRRAVVLGADETELRAGLETVAAALPAGGVVTGTADEGRTGFLFTGQGSQRAGMGRGLYETFPAFARAFDAVCAELDPDGDRPLKDVVFDGGPELHHTAWAQAGLFAVEVAAFRLLESWGLTPDLLLGHSIGEVAAAHCAGVLSLPHACRLVTARARLMGALPEGGAMLAVEATETEVLDTLTGQADIAAVNSPTSVVVSGSHEAIDALAAHWTQQGRRTRRLTVSHAFHSALMEPMLAEFTDAIRTLDFADPVIPLVSNLTGDLAEPGLMSDPQYWVRQVRHTVRFADGVTRLREQGVSRFVELGPDGVLCAMAQQTAADAVFAPLLRKDRDDTTTALTALARLWTSGADLDWHTLLPEGRRIDLPTYAFQRRRYWPDAPTATDTAQPSASPDEDRFWEAVERADLTELADTLHLRDAPETLTNLVPALSAWRQSLRQESTLASWRYRTRWTPLTTTPGTSLTGTWLLVTTDDSDPAHDVADALRTAGAQVTELTLTPDDDRATLTERLTAAAPDGIVTLLGGTHPRPWDPTGLAPLLRTYQALAATGLTAPLWCLTRGAVSTGDGDPLLHPEQAPVWGLGRVAALEAPATWGGLIDLPAHSDTTTGPWLATLLGGTTHEDQVALRDGKAYGRRVVRAPLPRGTAPRWTTPGTVLVTGGTGGLGGDVARWLARRGTPHLLLLSRRGADAPGASELTAELEASGTRVTVVGCDVADRESLAAALAAVPAEFPLTGVVHTAGLGVSAQLLDTDEEAVAEVMRAKVTGAALLDELTDDLDLFVVFSSIAATWGSGGQGAYAAGNAYLDALVEHRRARDLTATAIAWGPWAEVGMAADDEVAGFLRRRGLSVMDRDIALRALATAVDHDETTVSVADVDWNLFTPAFVSARPSPLLSELPDAQQPLTGTTDTATPSTELRDTLTAAPASERHRLLLDAVRAHTALVLGHTSVAVVEPRRAFRDLGFDSLTAVELRNLLTSETGLPLPATLVFDHPTPIALTDHLLGRLLGDTSEAADPAPAHPSATTDEPIAIVGMSCRYPGGANSAGQLWDVVASGRDVVSDFPTDRGWPEDADGGYARRGGFVDGATEFDAALFGISPREALAMDPQQRLLLEAAWEAFEHAGIDPLSQNHTRTGVLIGASTSGYGQGTDLFTSAEGHVLAGGSNSVISGRVAYTFGLEGPAVTVDTACSSSLVALHLAVQALRNGECDRALAGGVTVMTGTSIFAEFSRQGGLAADGRCKAFAGAADGTGWSEGVGVLVLERLSDAERLGHEVLAVVRGSAVNQDGASNGLTAPNGPSQERVIRQALANARLEATDVDVVEAHGTGTRLGDPIEAQALLATYGRGRDEDRPLWLGSVKSNIGHTQAAAGVAGVIKMVQALRAGTIPATLHVDEPTPHVDWSAGGVRLAVESRAWPETGRARRAGVSSFGMSGTNAHVIIEQAQPQPVSAEAPEPEGSGPVPLVLSAKSETALAGQADRLHTLISATTGPRLADVGHSLLSRAALEHRTVVLAADRDSAAASLDAATRDLASPGLVSGRVTPGDVVFVFPGQGSQWVGMGRELAGWSGVFRESLVECERALG
ncbi:type I polyketide synthase, partial [Streptomyces sp. NPDC087897]|uniref:type I polyketide synthase n=1 Tax=Streptomyces sp. NPDC087897 TaxID=3365817 RepID=UPI003811770B